MMNNNDKHGIPEILPPRSVVRLIKATKDAPKWKDQVGREFRIGYYSPRDGTDVIWLVNEQGEYEQTTDRASFEQFFEVVQISRERDLYGEGKKPFGKLTGMAQSERPVRRGVKPDRGKVRTFKRRAAKKK